MNDYGHEPWARANVARGSHSTPEQVAELLASLDAARAQRDEERVKASINTGKLLNKVDRLVSELAGVRADLFDVSEQLAAAYRRIAELESPRAAVLTPMDPETLS